MVSSAVLTAAPADVALLPVLASALVKVLRAELLLATLAVAVACVFIPVGWSVEAGEAGEVRWVGDRVPVAADVTGPAGAFDNAVPAGVAAEVAM